MNVEYIKMKLSLLTCSRLKISEQKQPRPQSGILSALMMPSTKTHYFERIPHNECHGPRARTILRSSPLCREKSAR